MGLLDPLFGSPDMPPPPDYKGAAEATAAGNLEVSRAAATANRYDQYTPLGDLQWTNLGSEQFDQEGYDAALAAYESQLGSYGQQDPNTPTSVFDKNYEDYGYTDQSPQAGAAPVAPDKADFTTMIDQDKWRSDVTLSPEVQGLFDKGLMMQDISADIGLTAGEQIKSTFADPFELDDFEGYREDVYDAMLERVETDINRDWQSRNADLYAAGIGRGTEAYGWEQMMRDRSLNDARLQAYQKATDQALRERGQTVKEALLQRNQPLNEYNAWKTGAQVDLPSFQLGGQQQTTAGPDYMNAALEQGQYDLAGYNADVMGQNALMSGLFSLGAGGLMGGYF
jgi:hypothetical protein